MMCGNCEGEGQPCMRPTMSEHKTGCYVPYAEQRDLAIRKVYLLKDVLKLYRDHHKCECSINCQVDELLRKIEEMEHPNDL